MTPFVLDLPPIYRGCDYPAIILSWKDFSGGPMSLNGWTPYCATRHFDLNARIINALNGTSKISMTRLQTAALKLGVTTWDWVWLDNFSTQVTPPHLSGRVEIREPLTPLARPL